MPNPMIKFYGEKASEFKLLRECIGLIFCIINKYRSREVFEEIRRAILAKRDYTNMVKSMGYIESVISNFSEHLNDASIFNARRRLEKKCLKSLVDKNKTI